MRHRLLAGTATASLALYTYDEMYMCRVMQRSARAVACGLYIFTQYKVYWTPLTASEVSDAVME
jgi:hypothetical protein